MNIIKNTHATVHGAPLVRIVEPFLQTFDWQAGVKNEIPISGPCGLIYEIENPFEQFDVSFAIADMRGLAFTKPHYHINSETEIYIVLQGTGLVIVGGQERCVEKGDVIVTPPGVVHFVLPKNDLVLAVVNTPPFNLENMIEVHETNNDVGFDENQFGQLIARQM
jgi:mannose-6-phosphate isomerase-like protein (cupin superfamily)